MSAATAAPPALLDDRAVTGFIVRGYLLLQLDLPAGVNERIAAALDGMRSNPGDAITDAVPELRAVLQHPLVRGAMISLAGRDYRVMEHRHWHCKEPGSPSMPWHQDGKNARGAGLDRFLGLYYPADVTGDMGPTIVVPGTHFRNAPTDRMRTYTNIRGQVPLVVRAGAFAITHYDLWHGTAANRSPRRRHMIKFLFNRTQRNAQPTWDHDPDAMSGSGDWNLRAESARPVDQLRFANPLNVSQTDHYKEVAKRHAVWAELTGVAAP